MATIIYNGKTISPDEPCLRHNDRGFTLGHGLFETLRVNKGTMPAFDCHWRRLEESAPLIGVCLPFSKQALEQMIDQLVIENDLKRKIAGVRLTVSQGESARGLVPQTPPSPNFVLSVFEYVHDPRTDYSVRIVTVRKNEHSLASRIKSISCLENILAKQEAVREGYDEAILLNTASYVADGAMTNVFMVQGGHIYTPWVADGALPGVLRRLLIEECQMPIVEKSISLSDLLNAEEVFLTNALMGIQPVRRINSTEYLLSSVGHAVAQRLQEVKHYMGESDLATL